VTSAEALEFLQGQLALLREANAIEATFDAEGRLQSVSLAPPTPAASQRDADTKLSSPVPRPNGAHVGIKPRTV